MYRFEGKEKRKTPTLCGENRHKNPEKNRGEVGTWVGLALVPKRRKGKEKKESARNAGDAIHSRNQPM
jgi:hypothetical protein